MKKPNLPYLPNSRLTYGEKWPSYRTDSEGYKYRYSEVSEQWVQSCGPETEG